MTQTCTTSAMHINRHEKKAFSFFDALLDTCTLEPEPAIRQRHIIYESDKSQYRRVEENSATNKVWCNDGCAATLTGESMAGRMKRRSGLKLGPWFRPYQYEPSYVANALESPTHASLLRNAPMCAGASNFDNAVYEHHGFKIPARVEHLQRVHLPESVQVVHTYPEHEALERAHHVSDHSNPAHHRIAEQSAYRGHTSPVQEPVMHVRQGHEPMRQADQGFPEQKCMHHHVHTEHEPMRQIQPFPEQKCIHQSPSIVRRFPEALDRFDENADVLHSYPSPQRHAENIMMEQRHQSNETCSAVIRTDKTPEERIEGSGVGDMETF